jgi:hypothetical protein
MVCNLVTGVEVTEPMLWTRSKISPISSNEEV